MPEPLIKYCGNKSLRDVQVVAKSKAHYIGFIFANSKRKVSPSDVNKWLRQVDIRDKKTVGIFVNAELKEIEEVLAKVPLSVIQCHGTESVDFIKQVKNKTSLHVWKVIHHNEQGLQMMKEFAGVADGYVVDTKVANIWGGSGISFDWKSIPLYQHEARKQRVPCFIAGGIGPDNIENLLHYDIDGFDISSGIELDGKKDHIIIQTIEKWVDTCVERTK
ncbi:phosphoribosylanthranilate isomerase [Bacillus sp. REN16]|uniref:phosphoribosylanthranilate isomerase n=1 Tax=Bacillus sp. REN16 TaxID=2887296 RepID=UPI001E4D3637|nr:phosphoribosylanthranilate isomerase [Bacillus sp. REN16]MCC3358329.1 phosphoribosylanthranilate isomerase [Bacillus sp. REN16]